MPVKVSELLLSDSPSEHGVCQVWVQILTLPLAMRSTMDSCLTFLLVQDVRIILPTKKVIINLEYDDKVIFPD